MNKHTPGQWLSRGKSDSVHESSNTHPYGCQIFRFAEDQGPSDDDLNLILSAPDLLEALESILEYAESGWDHTPICAVVARSVISKAKGVRP